eukprot:6741327-Prymnesium_polylepis.1
MLTLLSSHSRRASYHGQLIIGLVSFGCVLFLLNVPRITSKKIVMQSRWCAISPMRFTSRRDVPPPPCPCLQVRWSIAFAALRTVVTHVSAEKCRHVCVLGRREWRQSATAACVVVASVM